MITCEFEVYGTDLNKKVLCPVCGNRGFNKPLLSENKLECLYCNYILEFSNMSKFTCQDF